MPSLLDYQIYADRANKSALQPITAGQRQRIGLALSDLQDQKESRRQLAQQFGLQRREERQREFETEQYRQREEAAAAGVRQFVDQLKQVDRNIRALNEVPLSTQSAALTQYEKLAEIMEEQGVTTNGQVNGNIIGWLRRFAQNPKNKSARRMDAQRLLESLQQQTIALQDPERVQALYGQRQLLANQIRSFIANYPGASRGLQLPDLSKPPEPGEPLLGDTLGLPEEDRRGGSREEDREDSPFPSRIPDQAQSEENTPPPVAAIPRARETIPLAGSYFPRPEPQSFEGEGLEGIIPFFMRYFSNQGGTPVGAPPNAYPDPTIQDTIDALTTVFRGSEARRQAQLARQRPTEPTPEFRPIPGTYSPIQPIRQATGQYSPIPPTPRATGQYIPIPDLPSLSSAPLRSRNPFLIPEPTP